MLPHHIQKQKAKNFKIIDHYVLSLKEILGSGSYGIVYRGLNLTTKVSVAIKQVTFSKKPIKNNESSLQMTQALQNEITNMRLIDHNNVVKLFDVKKSSNNYYLICEYCSQGSLEAYLSSKSGQLSVQESLRFTRDIVSGFRFLYSKNIVHRDLKPANLLLHKNRIKIADFGFSKLVDHAMDSQQILSQVGSPLYMSPQILRGDSYSSKTDVWSLGIIWFQMLYGQTPWKGKSAFTLLKEIEGKSLSFPENPTISEEIKGILTKMLQLEEQERISWEELFEMKLLEEEIENNSFNLEKSLCELEAEFKQDEFLKYKALNQLYFQQNKVILLPFVEEIAEENKEKSDNYEIIIANQLEKEKKALIMHKISCWILHKRNRTAFISLFCLKFLDLVLNKVLIIRSEIYHRFVFLCLKLQMMSIYKLYMRLKSGDLANSKQISEENWKLFMKSDGSQILLKNLTMDLTIIKTLFTRCLEQTLNYINSKARKTTLSSNLKKLKSICDNNLADKHVFDELFQEMLKDLANYYYGFVKKSGGDCKKEILEFAYLLKIMFNRKIVFKWINEEPLDFRKLYEEIENVKITSIKEVFTFEN